MNNLSPSSSPSLSQVTSYWNAIGAEKAIKKLLEKGADLHLRDSGERTVLHKLAGVSLSDLRSKEETARFVNCFQLLLSGNSDGINNSKQAVNPTDVNAKDENGFTPLHYAIYMGIHFMQLLWPNIHSNFHTK